MERFAPGAGEFLSDSKAPGAARELPFSSLTVNVILCNHYSFPMFE